jgi:hypothetical protein
MDKERLEELKKTIHPLFRQDALDMSELIAEVEFLTKVVEQAVGLGCMKTETSPDGVTWLTTEINIQTPYPYPELAQYLKRGKE